MFDYIIVGCGFAGSVIAERIANILDKKVLIIEKRDHIAGNCYDYYDKDGILVHKYGPHIFHTHIKRVWEYLSQFCDWYLYQHNVLGFVDGKTVPIPFNMDALYELIPKEMAESLERKLIEKLGYDIKIPILKLRNFDDEDLKFLADFIYKKIFLNYTKKQWGLKPEELDPSVTERVPINISRDKRYFQDLYQGLPKEGYTNLFKNMLSNPNIKIMLKTDFKELIKLDGNKIKFLGQEFKGKLIFTGEIDEFFSYEFGKLPYRSLSFKFETKDQEFLQKVGTVNYPNDYDFTRITEFKHLTGQKHSKTSFVKEYPKSYEDKKHEVPCYPIPQKDNLLIYEKYSKRAKTFKNVLFLGRLAEYKYYNMDLVVDNALTLFKEELL